MLVVPDDGAGGHGAAVGELDVVGQRPAVEAGLEVGPLARRVLLDVLQPDAAHRAGLLAVLLLDDQLLGDVDQAPGEVPGVGGPQGGVDQALPGARRGDEVLEDVQALAVVRLDRPGDHVASGVGHQAPHARDLADLHGVRPGAGAHHHVDGVERVRGQVGLQLALDHGRGVVPDLHFLLAALTVGDDPLAELVLDLLGLLLVVVQDLLLVRRGPDVVHRDGQPGLGGEAEAPVLERVERLGHDGLRVGVGQDVDDGAHVALADDVVHVLEALGEHLVEEDPAGGRRRVRGRLAVGRGLLQLGHPQDHGLVEGDVAPLVGPLHGLGAAERLDRAPLVVLVATDLVGIVRVDLTRALGQVVGPDDHVLGGRDQRAAVGRAEHVVGRQHEDPALGLGLRRQGQVHGHLVAVEVGVERLADQRVDLDGLALDQHRLEGLDAEAVQGGRPVQQDRVLLDDVVEDVPHLGLAALDHALGRLDVLGQLLVDQLLHDEGLEQLQGHELGQAALVQAQLGAADDDRTAGVVDALAEQVLAEPALLALEHVGQGLEGPVAGARDRVGRGGRCRTGRRRPPAASASRC